MRREEFICCIGFEGSTAIVDGKMMRRVGSLSTRALAEAGLYKQAVCSAVFNKSPQELEDVLSVYNTGTEAPVRSTDELLRIFGVNGVPEDVKKITVV
jgi:hypothetical protein